ncbi:hypothetical protein, partial [Actinomadura sp. RB99]|uniref:hypothetical protein n=1 Tax=Actinomadura sp. RB99 TaxID=2691577 RepID=UPI0019D5A779
MAQVAQVASMELTLGGPSTVRSDGSCGPPPTRTSSPSASITRAAASPLTSTASPDRPDGPATAHAGGRAPARPA